MKRSRNLVWRATACLGLVVASVTAGSRAQADTTRIWVDASGRHSIRARLIETRDDKVVLLRQDGRPITIAIEELSERDKEYLQSFEDTPVENDNPLRLNPPQPPEIKPLPELDLPAADHVAEDGSSLVFKTFAEVRLLSELPQVLVPDPSATTIAISEARIPIYKVDVNDDCSRPIPITTLSEAGSASTSIVMSVSSGIRIPGEPRRDQLVRFDVEGKQAYAALKHDTTIQLLDHHHASGRSLVLVGFNSLGKGGELAVATGWGQRNVQLSHRRTMKDKKRGLNLPHLRWARWVDEEHVLAVIDQTLGLWNIVSGEQVYGIEGIDYRARPALSGGRRYVAVPYQGAVHLFASASGHPLGRIGVEKRVPSVSFSQEGNALAIVTSRRFRSWDLPSAALSADVESRRSLGGDPPVWIDSDLVLSGSGVLLSAFRGLPVWRYEIAATQTVAHGNHVVMFRKHPISELAIVSLPHPTAIAAMSWVDKSTAKIDDDNWRILGQSAWNANGWVDENVQVSALPSARR